MSRSDRLVRVVVTCADRKAMDPRSDLKLGTYAKTLGTRASRWISRLDSPKSDRLEAKNLYQGEHWSVVRQITDTASEFGCTAEVWVVSAGYGLVPLTAPLESYSATFSPRSGDSVAQGELKKNSSRTNRAWWNYLINWQGPLGKHPRSLADLARQDASAPMIVALSKTYLQAVRDDLVAAVAVMDGDADLMLVSTGTPPEGLEEVQLPCDARLVATLGGTRTSLNARVAKLIIQTSGRHAFDSAKVRRILQRDLDRSKDIPRYDHRERKTDFALREMIRTRLRQGHCSRTSLLREIRDSGFACEQKRFGLLYDEVGTGRQR